MLTPSGQNQKGTQVLELCPSINYKKNGHNQFYLQLYPLILHCNLRKAN